jgi:hypothetical protein
VALKFESKNHAVFQLLSKLTGVSTADKRDSDQDCVTLWQANEDIRMAGGEISTQKDAGSLAALIARAAADTNDPTKGLPPIDRWNPPFCGDIDMEIRSDGTWFYMGTPIGRHPLVRLFSTVLRKDEDGKTYLVTPVEKVGIRVEDAPFVAVEMVVTGEGPEQKLTFRTNVGDVTEAGPEHDLRFVIAGDNQQLKPYVHVRGQLEALVSRPVMYDLVERGEEVEIDGRVMFAIRSGGTLFPVMPADELERLSR